MARILLIGGHGKIALLLEPLLAGRGDIVTAVIRNPDHQPAVERTGATPFVADIQDLDTAQLSEIIRGHDAVVWSAGAGGGDPMRTNAVERAAADRSMDAAVAADVRRYVMVSYFGASTAHGVSDDNPFHAYAEAKAAADEHLRASGLDYTILAPSSLTLDPPTGRIDVAADTADSVPRADVATVIVQTLTDASTIGRTISFNSGSTPIAEALADGLQTA